MHRLEFFLVFAPQGDALENTNADEEGHERATPIADEGQGDTGDRGDADVHTDVDEDLEEQHGRHASGQKPAKCIARIVGNREDLHDEHDVEDNQNDAANKAHLLTQHRENIVGMLHAQKVQLALRAAVEATSK